MLRVSVIVPILNNASGLGLLLDCLDQQTLPSGEFELLLVDNGSRQEELDRYQGLLNGRAYHTHFLTLANPKNSYACRNLALQHRKAPCLAFTDSDCLPSPEWLASGVAQIESHQGLATGPIEFTFQDKKPSIGEWLDTRKHLNVPKACQEGKCFTANLFAHESVLEKIGPFDSSNASGGDVRWTLQATQSGVPLVLLQQAIVRHPARSYKELFLKKLRVGMGNIQSERMLGSTEKEIFMRTSIFLRRTGNNSMKSYAGENWRNHPDYGPLKLRLAIRGIRTATALGRLYGQIFKKAKPVT